MGGQIQIKITFSEAVREFLKDIDVGGSPPKKGENYDNFSSLECQLIGFINDKERFEEIVFKREERNLE